MVNAITSLIASGPRVLIDLLTEVPTSQDPATWSRPYDGRYYAQPADLVVTVNNLPSGLAFSIDVEFPRALASWTIVAIGVTCGGQFVTTNILTPPRAWDSIFPLSMRIIGQVNPVQQ